MRELDKRRLQLMEDEEKKIVALRNAINEGIASGRVVDFDSKKHLAALKANYLLP